ncbi:MAG: biotin/lipoyl-binding protein, partial [Candidatus Binatia bacterium]
MSLTSTPWKTILSLLAITGTIGGGWYSFAGSAPEPQTGRFRPVAVTQGTIEELITAQGKLEPKEYVDVGTQVSGQLKHIHVEIGDLVEKGRLLAEIDPRVYETRVEADQARLKSLKAQLNEQKAQATLAEQNLRRNQNLIAANAISRQTLQ